MSETYPPDGRSDQAVQSPPQPPLGAPPAPPYYGPPPRPPRQKLNWGYALLGFFTPWLATLLLGFVANAIAQVNEGVIGVVGPSLAVLVNLGVFITILVAFISGRSKGDTKLRSFGIGGLVSYAATVLIGLLAFGACFLTLGSNGLLGN